MNANPTAAASPGYNQVHRDLIRRAPLWNPLAYINRWLPARIATLAGELQVPPGARVLDFGCADLPYRRLFPADAEYLAADLRGNPQATLEIAPDGTVPVEDESVDVVLSTQVLEHVTDPGRYLSECARVLKPGGRLLLSTHGFMAYHPDPDDYWRWTCAGLKRAVGARGLELEHFEGIMGLGASGLQLFQDAYYWRLPRFIRGLFALVCQALITLTDRFESPEGRELNALVFVLVSRRP